MTLGTSLPRGRSRSSTSPHNRNLSPSPGPRSASPKSRPGRSILHVSLPGARHVLSTGERCHQYSTDVIGRSTLSSPIVKLQAGFLPVQAASLGYSDDYVQVVRGRNYCSSDFIIRNTSTTTSKTTPYLPNFDNSDDDLHPYLRDNPYGGETEDEEPPVSPRLLGTSTTSPPRLSQPTPRDRRTLPRASSSNYSARGRPESSSSEAMMKTDSKGQRKAHTDRDFKSAAPSGETKQEKERTVRFDLEDTRRGAPDRIGEKSPYNRRPQGRFYQFLLDGYPSDEDSDSSIYRFHWSSSDEDIPSPTSPHPPSPPHRPAGGRSIIPRSQIVRAESLARERAVLVHAAAVPYYTAGQELLAVANQQTRLDVPFSVADPPSRVSAKDALREILSSRSIEARPPKPPEVIERSNATERRKRDGRKSVRWRDETQTTGP
ncbi:hypothetical protein P7C73_g6386, partial [Tremellales sp. Uapishka_1]